MYKLKPFIWSSHSIIGEILNRLKPKTILDLGSGEGFLSYFLIYQPKMLIGIDKKPFSRPKGYSHFLQLDLEKENLNLPQKQFDCLVLADVLEHLNSPQRLLLKIKPHLTGEGFMIISLPNMGNLAVRVLYFFNIKPKMEDCLFDKTHKHDFTLTSAKKMLLSQNLQIIDFYAVPPPLPILPQLFNLPQTKIFNQGQPLYLLYSFIYLLSNFLPSLFAYQLIFICKIGE